MKNQTKLSLLAACIASVSIVSNAQKLSPLAYPEIRQWVESRVVYEYELPPVSSVTKHRVMFSWLDSRDALKEAKSCVAAYKKYRTNVFCYAYSNLRSLDADLRKFERKGSTICWAAYWTITGLDRKESGNTNSKAVLNLNGCPKD